MLVRDGVISDSLHELRTRKKRGKRWGFFWGCGVRLGGILEQPDKLPVDLSRVINYHPGKGLGLGPPVAYSRHTHTHTESGFH